MSRAWHQDVLMRHAAIWRDGVLKTSNEDDCRETVSVVFSMIFGVQTQQFLASQAAQEVMLVSESFSDC